MFNQIQIPIGTLLMGKVLNIFAVEVGRYKKKAPDQRLAFAATKAIWLEATLGLLSTSNLKLRPEFFSFLINLTMPL